ncbi:hypothetical protein DOTSEDRAFT_33788 [Dothistroma septosporum NZE10]|uniref:Uncharacterized protein n=1 Tax=Dothistroma septosporum (strain NZE10 / CBS 128990) TaxID=675120 RepID=N1PPC2_DOTSN|nr:hypothetical protein DOTSEDRAFT_33788 [Dothistroma septosporum NZE10]
MATNAIDTENNRSLKSSLGCQQSLAAFTSLSRLTYRVGNLRLSDRNLARATTTLAGLKAAHGAQARDTAASHNRCLAKTVSDIASATAHPSGPDSSSADWDGCRHPEDNRTTQSAERMAYFDRSSRRLGSAAGRLNLTD